MLAISKGRLGEMRCAVGNLVEHPDGDDSDED
jgi:hypothetical protein